MSGHSSSSQSGRGRGRGAGHGNPSSSSSSSSSAQQQARTLMPPPPLPGHIGRGSTASTTGNVSSNTQQPFAPFANQAQTAQTLPPAPPAHGMNRIAPGRPPSGQRPSGPPGVALTRPPPAGVPQLGYHTHVVPGAAGSTYAGVVANAPPVYAIPPLDVDISMMEICTFFPIWFLIPDVAMRAIRNGWTRRDIAKATIHSNNRLTRGELQTAENRVQKQISEGGKMYQNISGNVNWNSSTQVDALGPEDDLTANIWELRTSYTNNDHTQWRHMPLAVIANRVINWPTGQDARMITACLRYAQANPHLNLDTSHWHLIRHSLNLNPGGHRDSRDDVRARNNFRNNVPDP